MLLGELHPENTGGSMLGHRRRQWINIDATMDHWSVFAGMPTFRKLSDNDSYDVYSVTKPKKKKPKKNIWIVVIH